MSFPKPLLMAQRMVADVLRAGDHVIDATVGNGHDTVFLAKLVGAGGKVIGFDVQEEALKCARKRLEDEGVLHDGVLLHPCGHERMAQVVKCRVKAVMFNLGYLPRADKAVITTVETTLPALRQACDLLEIGGIITIMCYPGHGGGDVEAQAVVKWAESLPRGEWRVVRYGMINAPNNPPFLIGVELLGIK